MDNRSNLYLAHDLFAFDMDDLKGHPEYEKEELRKAIRWVR